MTRNKPVACDSPTEGHCNGPIVCYSPQNLYLDDPIILRASLRLKVLGQLALCAAYLLAAPNAILVAASVGSTPPAPVYRPPGPPNPLAGDSEGYSVAGSSRFLVIGRPGATVEYNGEEVLRAGKVVVWELDESYFVDDVVKKRFWVIDAITPVAYHYFGSAVAAGDRWIAVTRGMSRSGFGGPSDVPPKIHHVQLIEFPPDGGWLPGPELPGPADSAYRQPNMQFGISIAMHRDRLVVGSRFGALVYEVSPLGVWTRTQILTNNSTDWVGLGTSVAIHEDLIAVGAPASPNPGTNGLVTGQGGVILYRRKANGLYEPEKEFRSASVPPSDVFNLSDAFGTSLALETREGVEWLAVGSVGRDAQIGPRSFQPDAGSATLFRRIQPAGEWTFHQEITNSFDGDLTQHAKAGNTIALSNGRLALGAVASGGTQTPPAHGVVGFFAHDEERDRWIRTGEVTGHSRSRYGVGLHGFEHGFLIGTPGFNTVAGSGAGDWEWRPTDPYVNFINQAAGPFVAGTPAQDRRADVDPDGDGILNFDELFFGSDPLIPNTNRIIVPVLDQAVQQFKLQWQQAPNTFGLSSRVDWSSNLSSWTTNNLQIIPLGTVPNSTAKRFEARLSTTGQSNVFFRLLVE
jgi:hypothetical protein